MSGNSEVSVTPCPRFGPTSGGYRVCSQSSLATPSSTESKWTIWLVGFSGRWVPIESVRAVSWFAARAAGEKLFWWIPRGWVEATCNDTEDRGQTDLSAVQSASAPSTSLSSLSSSAAYCAMCGSRHPKGGGCSCPSTLKNPTSGVRVA